MKQILNCDIVIVGGGIAGLYSAYKIQKIAPRAKVLILEKYSRKWLGGRIGNVDFHNVNVVNGAGVGRKEKDHLLIQLLKELDIPFHEFTKRDHYATTISPVCTVKKTFMFLRKEYNKEKDRKHITFKKFALPLLGKDAYQHFLTCSGYTDYEKEDAYDTLYHYGFDDNYNDWSGLSIPWKKLVDELSHKIGLENIKLHSDVVNIEKIEDSCRFLVHSKKGTTYSCGKVIIATTIESVLKLVPGASNKNSIYQQIRGQPFLRVYAKFAKSSIPVMKHYVPGTTIVPGPLHKIIPFDPDTGIYMIAYTDNEGAVELKEHLENIPKNRELFCQLLEISLGIPENTLTITSLLDFYWSVGTHYYMPLKDDFKNREEFIREAQHPMPGMVIVGEMIGINQGWVEGALDSVEKVVTQKWITTPR
jgi:hypothetical protein